MNKTLEEIQQDYSSIPDEMKKRSNWVLWKIVHGKKTDKDRKKPYRVDNINKPASSTDPETWSTFDEAVKEYAGCQHRMNGIGFVLGGSGLVCVDVDHCLGETAEPGQVTVNETVNTLLDHYGITQSVYGEVSQSGTGVHYFMKGHLDRAVKTGGIEIYETARYIATTGKRILGDASQEIADGQAVIDQLVKEYAKTTPAPKQAIEPNRPQCVCDLTDEQVLSKMFEAKGRALYDGSVMEHSSQSEADLALCDDLAFYTGKNADQMDRLFRGSGLMRSKWDTKHGRATYGETTIKKAIQDTSNMYDPNFGQKNRATMGNSSPTQNGEKLLYTLTKSGKPGKLIDKNIKNYLLSKYTTLVLENQLYIYKKDEGYYKWDEDEKWLRTTIEDCLHLPAELVNAYSVDRIVKLVLSNYRINNTLESINQAPPWYINFKDCVLDAKTLKRLPHDPKYKFINCVPHKCPDFNKPVTPEEWMFSTIGSFIDGIIPDHDDKQMLFEYAGYCFSRMTSAQKLLIIQGNPNTGKSTILRFLDGCIGTRNISGLSLDTLSGDRARFSTSFLNGKLLNIANDLSNKDIRDNATLKQITGEDKIQGEYKGGKVFSFRSYARLIFSCNTIPLNTGDSSQAFYRRMLILQVPRRGEKIDRLEELISTDPERQLFIKVAVQAFHNALKREPFSLFESGNSQKAAKCYRLNSDNVAQFIEECCKTKPVGNSKTRRATNGQGKRQIFRENRQFLYLKYKDWCDQNSVFKASIKSNVKFYESLRNKGFTERKNNSERYFEGIKVNIII